MIARERDRGQIVGIASRAERDVFLNGHVWYVSATWGNFAPVFAVVERRHLLNEGFTYCRTLHERGHAPAYLTSIVEDNHAARRLLSGLRSPAAPRFVRAGALVTLAIPRGLGRSTSRRYGVEIRQGSLEILEDIVACLDRSGCRHQFAPRWTADDLQSDRRTRGLDPGHFLVAMAGGRVVGCAAIWDQRGFKQVIVRGYSQRLARWRHLVNFAGPLIGVPALPKVGHALEFVYLSHVAIDEDRPEVTAALVSEARCRLPAGVDYIVTAFAEGSGLLSVASKVAPHRTYRSVLYLACWPNGQHLVESIDSRLPHPEVAIL